MRVSSVGSVRLRIHFVNQFTALLGSIDKAPATGHGQRAPDRVWSVGGKPDILRTARRWPQRPRCDAKSAC